ncbi:MAG: acetyl-CoA acetyltransferase [Dehalococcoidia bacterium]|nr:acetyl-CoA acetyltransferase [Dehalococcoidia bacterium]
MARNYPVVVGVAQLTNRPRTLDDAVEPIEMMARAAREAADDAGSAGLLAELDSVQVVNSLTWPYQDPPGFLAQRIGATPRHKVYTTVGGETPQRLVNETAGAIAEGHIRLALIAGAEALESRRLARRLNQRLDWSVRGNPEHVAGDTRQGFNEMEARHGATLPTRVYPLFENAIRAHLGHTIDQHQEHLGRLYARFSAVAAANPYAWYPAARSAQEIRTAGPGNRMVCFPYPKLMNAIIETDQAAALIVTGSQTARELGIPEERWVYLHGCGDAVDKWYVSERLNYYHSPAIRAATQRALGMAGIGVDGVAMFDLYSCFPAAVQLATDALGLRADDPRPLTVTGGLPYAGGPGNNYVSHSIAAAVGRLRENPDQYALVTGLGWFATKHSAGVYSARPPAGAWERTRPQVDQAQVDAMESPPFAEEANGSAVVETYTVAFNREGEPEQGIIVGRLHPHPQPLSRSAGEGSSAPRFFANTEPDPALLWQMTREEFVGRRGSVVFDPATRKNAFRPA